MTLQGNSWKLAGNSFYGKTLESGQNYHSIKVGDESFLKKSVKSPKFSAAEPVTEDLFEVKFARKFYREEKPLIIGFFILQYSKLRVSIKT